MQEAEIAMQLAGQGAKIMLDGSVVVVRFAGKMAVHAATLLAAALSGNKKTRGKVRLKNMLKEKDGLSLFQIKPEDFETFRLAAKAYGIKYCVVKDKNSKDDSIMDLFVRTTDAPIINRIVEKYNISGVEMDAVIEPAEEKDQGKSETLTEKENLSGKDYLADFEKGDITINLETLLYDENETHYITRVPGTYKANIRFLEIPKEEAELVYDGKSLKFHVEEDKEYHLLDNKGERIPTAGTALLVHYDKKEGQYKKGVVVSEMETRPSVKPQIEKFKRLSDETRTNTPGQSKSTNKFNNFNQRTYDWEELEKKLISNNRKVDAPERT